MSDNISIHKERLTFKGRACAHVVALAILAWLAMPMMQWLAGVFRYPKDDMGHGWVVPLFSLYLLWRRRAALRASVGPPSWGGALISLPALLVLWMGERGGQVRLSQLAVYFLLWSLTYAFWGRRMARLTAFPVVFLLFTVPLGFLDVFTIRLRLLTAMLSNAVLNGIGVPVARIGTGLRSLAGEGFSLDVADPCSGLRSIFALTAITAAYAYMTQRHLWQKWLLFACSVPLAVIGNMARIFTIAVVARYFGQEAGTGFYHDYSGYLVFLVGTLLMMQTGTWIARLGSKSPIPQPLPSSDFPIRATRVRPHHFGFLLGLPLAMLAIGIALNKMPDPVVEPQDFLVRNLPENIGDMRGSQPWFCHNEQCLTWLEDLDFSLENRSPVCPQCGGPMHTISLSEHTVLPPDTLFLKRNYHEPLGGVYRVTVVINGESRQSIHRPELCLPAQGYFMEHSETVSFPLGEKKDLDVKLVDVRRSATLGSGYPMGQAYFFISSRHDTASHYIRILISARARAFENRVTRWGMVTITADIPFNTPESRTRLHAFLKELYPQLRLNPKSASLAHKGRSEL